MTDKELRKLRRVELLELLVDQAAEMEDLRRQLEEAREALAERELHIKESGSMAEAALRLNGVFEAADQAAQQYLRSIEALKEQHSLLLRTAREKTEQQVREALDRTREKCRELEAETRARCQAMLEQAGQAEGPEEEAE